MTGARPPARRGRWAVLLLAAAALVGLVALPTWVVGEGSHALDGTIDVPVSGSLVAPQTGAAALVLAAAAGAVALVGRAGRWVVAAVAAGAGVLVVTGALTVLADPAGAAAATVAEVTGVAPDGAAATTTVAPAVAAVLGALVIMLAGALARARGAWDQRSRRHERPAVRTAGAPGGDEHDERADWDALSRGDDPS